VTEQFDMTTARNVKMLRRMNAPTRNRVSIEKTLANLASKFTK
jgi:hypothetical protein